MINFDDVTKENIKKHNPNWPQIPDHPRRILIIGGSRSGKTNTLFNLLSHQPNIDKIYFYQFLINKRENADLKHFYDVKAFIWYSNNMGNFYKNIEEYNPNKKCKILIVFDDMIADMLNNKKRNLVVTELFIRGRKLNISLVFIRQYYFAIPKNSRLNCAHHFITNVFNKRELQQIAFNHSSDIDIRDFMNLCKKCTPKPHILF